jgi:large subunit ribosomal protein L6
MSRVGKQPVTIASGVTVTQAGNTLSMKGPKGSLERKFPDEVSIEIKDSKINFSIPNASNKRARSMWGLSRRLAFNMVNGVSNGYTTILDMTGVGYKAAVQGELLTLTLGYSHDVIYVIPKGIAIKTPKPTQIEIVSHDKELIGQVAAEIRALRAPEPYKGKGIRYSDEVIRRKEGKKK